MHSFTKRLATSFQTHSNPFIRSSYGYFIINNNFIIPQSVLYLAHPSWPNSCVNLLILVMSALLTDFLQVYIAFNTCFMLTGGTATASPPFSLARSRSVASIHPGVPGAQGRNLPSEASRNARAA